MEPIKQEQRIFLVESSGLGVIKIAGYSANLSLSTQVVVNTETNETTVKYYVNSWSMKHKRINKYFTDYKLACEYYDKIYTKFAKQY